MIDIYFLSGRINSLEKKFINEEKLKKILESKTFEEFVGYMEDTFFNFSFLHSINYDEIVSFFENERLKLIEEIKKNFEFEYPIYPFFLLKYDYHNLYIILENKKDFSLYGTVKFYMLQESIEKKDFSKLPEYLISGSRILILNKSLKEKFLLLNKSYYEELFNLAEKISEFVRNYVKIEIDFANLKTYFNSLIFEEKIEKDFLIPNGKIKIEDFLDREKLLKKFNSEYKFLSFPVPENLLISKYNAEIRFLKEGRVKPFGIDKIISFYLAREIEIENIFRITLGKFYKFEEVFYKKTYIFPYSY